MHGQQALVRAAGHRRVQHRGRDDVPAQLDVALVGDHGHAALAAPGHPGPQLLDRQHPAVRVARGVQPHQHRVGDVVRGHVAAQHRQPGHHRADLVGRVGDLGDHHGARPQPEQGRQQRHQLLGAHRRDDRRDGAQRVGQRHAQPAPQPARRGEPDVGRAQRRRVARRVGRGGQRRAQDVRGRVHRRADGQVDHPPGVLGRAGAGRAQGVPGEVRQRAGAHSPCGGSAATSGWSLAIFPVRAAPPGLPSSEKNSTLAL
ncbi:unannotated protein [freshwater metagenome]|uniref:Unannotated protein n=1 Tax=freshwater metagenome TaxID=449393 RepID=A0A6J7IAW7_9ZZZZ